MRAMSNPSTSAKSGGKYHPGSLAGIRGGPPGNIRVYLRIWNAPRPATGKVAPSRENLNHHQNDEFSRPTRKRPPDPSGCQSGSRSVSQPATGWGGGGETGQKVASQSLTRSLAHSLTRSLAHSLTGVGA